MNLQVWKQHIGASKPSQLSVPCHNYKSVCSHTFSSNTSTLPSCRKSGLHCQSTASIAQPTVSQNPSTHPTVAAANAAQAILSNPAVQLVVAVFQVTKYMLQSLRSKVAACLPQPEQIDLWEVRRQLKGLSKASKMMAFFAPLAQVAQQETLGGVYARTFERAGFGFAKMYVFCLFMRVLLSWFPSIDWNAQPWAFLRLITEPYLSIFRNIIPPIFGSLDFTPLLGFMILQDVVEFMSPWYTWQHEDTNSELWTSSDVMCFFNGR